MTTALCKAVESNSELEAMVGRHEVLVHKLREECRRLVDELQQVSAKYKSVDISSHISLYVTRVQTFSLRYKTYEFYDF